MTAVLVKSFIINNISTTDAEIATGIGVTSTVFSATVIPISNTRSRVVVIYN